MTALIIVAVALTAFAFIFCTTVGIKIIMEESLMLGICNIALGVCNLMLCIINIIRLVDALNK